MRRWIIFLNIVLLCSCSRQHIAELRIKAAFDIDISKITYDIIDFKDEWTPLNGDGEFKLVASLENSSESELCYIKNQLRDKGGEQLRKLPENNFWWDIYHDCSGLFVLREETNSTGIPTEYYIFLFDETHNELFVNYIFL